MGRILRHRSLRYGIPVHGGDDPTFRDVLLEEEEIRICEEGAHKQDAKPEYDDDRLWAAAHAAAGDYEMRLTGDPVTDELERQLAAGEEIDWDLLS